MKYSLRKLNIILVTQAPLRAFSFLFLAVNTHYLLSPFPSRRVFSLPGLFFASLSPTPFKMASSPFRQHLKRLFHCHAFYNLQHTFSHTLLLFQTASRTVFP